MSEVLESEYFGGAMLGDVCCEGNPDTDNTPLFLLHQPYVSETLRATHTHTDVFI